MIDFKRFFTMTSAHVTGSDEYRYVAAKPFRGFNWGSIAVPWAITQWEDEGGSLPPTALAMNGCNHSGGNTNAPLNANAAISDALPLGVLITDVYGNCVYSNTAYERLSGRKQAHLLGSHWVSFIHPDDREGLVRDWQEAMRQLQPFISEARLVRTDGSVIWVRQTITVVNESRLEYGHAHTVEDISVTRESAAAQTARQQVGKSTRRGVDKNAHLAEHDNLTGLPGRVALNERYIQAQALARRHDKQMALLFIDLDNFKEINDRLGHESGDRLLISLASRLLAGVRSTDTVCRYGGDEFVILLSEISQPDHAAEVAAKLRAAVAGYAQHDGQAIELSLSIGVSVFPDDGQNAEMLLQKADAAMHQAKTRGKNCICTATRR